MVFHISIPMVYVESLPLFFSVIETFKDMVNNTMAYIHASPDLPLEQLDDKPTVDGNKVAARIRVQAYKHYRALPI